jgi:hypothetical protein
MLGGAPAPTESFGFARSLGRAGHVTCRNRAYVGNNALCPACEAQASRQFDEGLSKCLPGCAGNVRSLSEIPCLHLGRVDVEIGDVDVAHVQTFWREITWILSRATMTKLIAAPKRQRKVSVTAADARQRVR